MIKASLTAILLSSVSLVPAATIALFATTDIVAAKSDNAGGKGGGNGGGNKGGNSASAKSKSKATASGGGKSKSTSRKKRNDPVGNFLRKVTGQDKKKSRVAKAAPARAKDPMHPSNFGKMNGPLNANVNALIAHVKNGNTNGPIGGMAALAVAGYAAEGAEDTLALAEKFAELDQTLIDNGYFDDEGNPDLQAYLDDLEPVPGNGINETIESSLSGDVGALPIEDALRAENNNVQDFASVEEYEAWRDGTDGAEPIADVENLLTNIGDQERPGDDEIDYANDRIEDRTSAEDYMLSIWNKGDGDDTMRSSAEDDLIQTLYDRIESDGSVLTDAIEEHADLPEPPMDDTASCDLEEGCDEIDDDVVAAAN